MRPWKHSAGAYVAGAPSYCRVWCAYCRSIRRARLFLYPAPVQNLRPVKQPVCRELFRQRCVAVQGDRWPTASCGRGWPHEECAFLAPCFGPLSYNFPPGHRAIFELLEELQCANLSSWPFWGTSGRSFRPAGRMPNIRRLAPPGVAPESRKQPKFELPRGPSTTSAIGCRWCFDHLLPGNALKSKLLDSGVGLAVRDMHSSHRDA